jgi:hypothetical protein
VLALFYQNRLANKESESDYKKFELFPYYLLTILRINRTMKAIKNAKAKNPKIIESIPKKFLSKSFKENLYRTKEIMKIIKKTIRFFHARSILSLRRTGPLTDLAVIFFAPLFFPAIFDYIIKII